MIEKQYSNLYIVFRWGNLFPVNTGGKCLGSTPARGTKRIATSDPSLLPIAHIPKETGLRAGFFVLGLSRVRLLTAAFRNIFAYISG